MEWFSAKIRRICLVEDKGATYYMDSVYVFQARDFQEAFQHALEIGKDQDEEYLNSKGKKVFWKLKEIISLDIIRRNSLDGAEVYSELIEVGPGENLSLNTEFHPEQSEPIQTI